MPAATTEIHPESGLSYIEVNAICDLNENAVHLHEDMMPLFGRALSTAIIAISSLQAAIRAEAAPIFEWAQPWQVTIVPGSSQGTVDRLSANFGASATAAGQITDVGNVGGGFDVGQATAFMQAASAVTATSSARSVGNIAVKFSRQFNILDSPLGWDVSLDGFIAGQLFNITNVNTTNSLANVFASASIFDTFNNATNLFIDYTSALISRQFRETNQGLSSQILSNGQYIVSGQFGVLVTESGTGQAIANFYDGLAGFQLTVNAVPLVVGVNVASSITETTLSVPDTETFLISATLPPEEVPEPPTIVLLLASLGLLLFATTGAGMLNAQGHA
jgi:hypothetical protein